MMDAGVIHVLLILIATILLQCTNNAEIAGGTAGETGNAISGVILDDKELDPKDDRSNRVADATVHLYPGDYNPHETDTLPDEWKVKTDGRGEYLFKKVTAGVYNIQAWHPDEQTAALIHDVTVTGEETGEIEADTAVLKEPGVLRISLMDFAAEEGGYVYIPGTSVMREINTEDLARGYVLLNDVPAGNYKGFNYTGAGKTFDLEIRSGFEVVSSDTTSLGDIPAIIIDTVVTGTIVKQNGEPAAGAVVRLVPSSYNPLEDTALPDSLMDITNAGGVYLFAGVNTGAYRIEALDLNDGARLISGDIEAANDTTVVPEDTLKQPGKVVFHFPEDFPGGEGFIVIPGTGIYTVVDSLALAAGYVLLHQVPEGMYAVISHVAGTDISQADSLAGDIEVLPGGTTIISPYYGWRYRTRLTINASATGADISDDLVNFPLLVRLTSSSFTIFENADSDGNDLRFSKADGTPLPFDIERWDSQNNLAEIWVRLDTVHADNDSQYIYMYTGQSAAPAQSSGAAVFDTAAGFTAVWHLDELPDGNPGTIRDRTANEYNGTSGPGMGADALTDGITGRALDFDGTDDYIELPASRLLIPEANGLLSISAWIRPDAMDSVTDSIAHRVISIKENALDSSILAFGITSNGKVGHYSREADTVLEWSSSIIETEVYLITLTFDATAYRGYVNGVLDSTFLEGGLMAGGAANAILGSHMLNDRNFNGLIDEVRISHAARSAAWIKMCYENQKQNSMVVIIE
jgi:hypothetical protein